MNILKHLIVGGGTEPSPEPNRAQEAPVDALLELRKRIVLDEWFDRAGMVPVYDGPTIIKLLLKLVEQEAKAYDLRPRRAGNPGKRDLDLIWAFKKKGVRNTSRGPFSPKAIATRISKAKGFEGKELAREADNLKRQYHRELKKLLPPERDAIFGAD